MEFLNVYIYENETIFHYKNLPYNKIFHINQIIYTENSINTYIKLINKIIS